MKDYLIYLMLLVIFLIASIRFDDVFGQEQRYEELYMPNDDEGFVVLSVKDCPDKGLAKTFPHYAYATEHDGTKHEGCWTVEDKAPKGFEPLVNIYFEGQVVSYRKELFSPEKKRWDFKVPEIVVKPENTI
jgi:hypothetical protein